MLSNEFSLLLSEVENHEYNFFDWNDYRIGYFISKNRGKSNHNEDCLFIEANEKQIVFGVSDGAGGHPRGKDAAKIAGEEVLKFFKTTPVGDVHMLEVLESINDKVLDLKVGARTTLAMGTIDGDNLRSFNVGDSEIIYWNSQGSEIYKSIPQSDVGYRIEAGLLSQDESLDDPERHSVNNLIGDVSIRIETASKMKIKKGHTILIGSDGIFDNLSHEQLTELVGKGSFEKSFEDLCQYCIVQDPLKWKKDDDISMVLIRKIKS